MPPMLLGPDDEVAQELEASAGGPVQGRGGRRGGVTSSAQPHSRRTQRFADPGDRRCARQTRSGGAPRRPTTTSRSPRSHPYPSSSGPRSPGAPLGSSSSAAAVVRQSVDDGQAGRELLSAAKGLDTLDDDLARQRLSRHWPPQCTRAVSASQANWSSRRRSSAPRSPDISLTRPIDLLLSGMTSRIIDGPGAGYDHLRAALQYLEHQRAERPVPNIRRYRWRISRP